MAFPNEVWVKFSDEQMLKLWQICQDKNWSMSRCVRELVQEALDEYGPYTV